LAKPSLWGFVSFFLGKQSQRDPFPKESFPKESFGSDREKKEKPRKTGKSLLQQLKNIGFSLNLFNSGTSIRGLRGRKAKAQNLLQRSIIAEDPIFSIFASLSAQRTNSRILSW
jgi:hypothetical protein